MRTPKPSVLALATFLLFSIIFFTPPSFAQIEPNLEAGMKPFGSYEGGAFDSVSLTNGNLFFHVPIYSYPQRGSLPAQLAFLYNNKGYRVDEFCNTRTGVCSSSWSWLGGPVGGPSIQFEYGIVASINQTLLKQGTYISVTTADAFPHQMGLLSSPGQFESVDGSGLFYISNQGSGPIRIRNGDLWTPTSNGSTSQDANGNIISETFGVPPQPNITVTDTLNRSATYNGATDTSGCAGPRTVGGAVLYTLPGPSGQSRLVKSCNVNISVSTHFNQLDEFRQPIAEYTGTLTFIQNIIIYNGVSWTTSPFWTFEYSSDYGDLTRVTLPTGGTISYTWITNGYCGAHTHVSRAVSQRTVDAQDGTGPQTTTYASISFGTAPATLATNALGNDTVHVITALNGSCSLYETQTLFYQGSYTTGTLLKTVNTDYSSILNPLDTTSARTAINVYPIRVTTKRPNGQTSKVETDNDSNLTIHPPGNPATTISYGNSIETREYDYGNGAPGPLLRRTDKTYLAFTSSSYMTVNMLDRVASTTVYNGSSNQVAKTTYIYDSGSVQSSGITTQHVSVSTPRGNQTSVQRWLNTTGGTLNTNTSYFDTGMPYHVTDPRGNVSSYSYSSTYAGAYLTQTNLPDTGSPAVHHVTSGAYDFNTGLLTSYADQNSQTTNYQYDLLGRTTSATFPDGGQTTFTYTDTPLSTSIERKKKINSTLTHDFFVFFDGLARQKQTQLTSDLAGTDYTDTTYDALGRVATVSNPHRSTASPTDGTTTFLYDTLGRTTQVTRPDGATVLITYIGPATEFQDESRVTRISQSDGLGRLTSVCEVSSATLIGTSGTPAACGQDIAATGFLTTYQYDALDNLTQVNQGGLNTRTFSYDSLSRLTSGTNPESGTICYGTYSANVCQGNGYDADGNLTTKTDARSITTTYSYDALNRLTQKTYSDTTPKAVFNYDETAPWGWTLSNPIGRLTTTYTKNSSGGTIVSSLNSYDPMGRVAVYEQCQPLSCGPAPSLALAYTYNLLGEPISMHPSQTNVFNFTLSYSYNSTAHLATITSSLNDANHPQTLFSGASYNAPALLTTATLGGIVNEHRSYNSRLWPTSITVDSSVYSYSMTSYAPNGNILGVNDSVNGNWVYKYDDFSRLTCSNLSSNGTCAAPTNGTPTYTYDYDRFGNRWHQNGPQSMQFSFSGNNNRMDGYSYDTAGNLSNDGNYAYTYDAENRIIQVNLPGPGGALVATYTYDASGNRVSKTSGGVSLAYFYDTEGHVVVETNLNTSPATWTRGEIFAAGRHIATYSGGTSGTTNFIETDWLGTERVRTNHSGAVCETITSLPFGDGQSTSTSCGDLSPLHFTGKERDSETGLDNFGARYDSSSMGRFMSPDPFYHDSHVADPQSWNQYAYARNNPLRYTDPTGSNATVSTSCSTNANNHTTCNANISASIAIYAAPGSGITQDQLNAAAGAMQNSIQNAWSGQFTQDGVTYNVATQVNVSVAGSQDAAMQSGAQNVIGMTNGDPAPNTGAYVNFKSPWGALTSAPDTGMMDINGVDNYAKHEFTHLLGVGDRGDYNVPDSGPAVMSNTWPNMRPGSATGQDLSWGVKEATQSVGLSLSMKSWYNGSGGPLPTPFNFSATDKVGAPIGRWWAK